MPLDVQSRAALDQMAHLLPFERDVQSMRNAAQNNLPPLDVERAYLAWVRDMSIPGKGSPVPIRIYHPNAESCCGIPPPLLIYFHGGGYVLGSLDGWDGLCCNFARYSGFIVVSVDYRLAPENKFPAGLEDCYSAVEWAALYGASIGGDPSRIAVAGDSAGGNLAAAVCLMAKDRCGPKIGFQVLLYPPSNARANTVSRQTQKDGQEYLLTTEMMKWFTAQYLASPEDKHSSYYAPCKAESLAGLPSALVVTAEFDPLRDGGKAYANRLAQSGVDVEYICYEGTIHGFMNSYRNIDKGREAIAVVSDRLRRSCIGPA